MNPDHMQKTHEHSSASQIVHDIRNSLGIILMRSQLLSLHADHKELDTDALKKTSETIDDQVKIIQKLLDKL